MKRTDPYREAAKERANTSERLVVLVDRAVLAAFDEVMARRGFQSRSDAIRAVIADTLEQTP